MRLRIAVFVAFGIVVGGGDSSAQAVIAGQEDHSSPERQCPNPTQEPCSSNEPCFGFSVGISGNLAIVGSPDQLNEDNEPIGVIFI